MSKDSAQLLFRLYELQVYIKNGILGYVIVLPLVNRCNFNIYRLIPIPVPLDRTKFLYVDTGKSFLWVDQVRAVPLHDGRRDGRIHVRYWIPCKMFVSKISPSCLLTCMRVLCSNCCNPGEAFPPFFEKRKVEISNSIWIQLANTEWIYFVPSSKSITIL